MPGQIIPQIVAAVLAISLAGVALIHFYWAIGGRRGLELAIPMEQDGTPVFSPGSGATLLIGMGLAISTLVALERGFLWPGWIPPIYLDTGCWILAAVYSARVLGDFRYFGLFRRIKGSPFARWDAMLYTPFCAGLAGGFFLLLVW